MANDKPVPLVEIANHLGRHRNSIRHAVECRGFLPFRIRDARNGTLYLSADDADSFIKRIESEKELTFRDSYADDLIDISQSGLYTLHVPSYNHSVRLKIGWSDHLDNRLATHRTLIPDLIVKAIWPTTQKWAENVLLAWARTNAQPLSEEVFEFDSIELLDEAICRFDALLKEIGVVQ